MKNYIAEIEVLWGIKDSLKDNSINFKQAKQLIDQILVCEKISGSCNIIGM